MPANRAPAQKADPVSKIRVVSVFVHKLELRFDHTYDRMRERAHDMNANEFEEGAESRGQQRMQAAFTPQGPTKVDKCANVYVARERIQGEAESRGQ